MVRRAAAGLRRPTTKRATAFVAGPIQGVEQEQSYRDALRHILPMHGYNVLDPWARERALYGRHGERWWERVPPRRFIERDLRDIERCDLFVAYLPFVSAGTCMELFHAKMRGKKTLVVCTIDNPSPWIRYHADHLFRDLSELQRFLAARRGRSAGRRA